MIQFRLPEHFTPIKQPLDLPKPPFPLGFTSKMAIPAGLWEYGCAPCDQRKSFTSNLINGNDSVQTSGTLHSHQAATGPPKTSIFYWFYKQNGYPGGAVGVWVRAV